MVARRSPQTERIVGIINLLTVDTSGAGVTLSELARRLQISKATCYPMLEALTQAGFLTRHPARKTFHLGPALIAAGQAAATQNPLFERARDAMVELGHTLDLTAWLWSEDGDQLRLVDQAWHSRRVTPYMRVGELLPFTPPRGAAVVAWGDERAAISWLNRGHIDEAERPAYLERLVQVRDTGYVVTLEDVPIDVVRSLAGRLGDAMTPDDRARLLELLNNELPGGPGVFLTVVDPRERYSVRSIEAPVMASDGTVAFTLGVTNLPAMHGKDVTQVGDQVRAAAVAASPHRAGAR
ncbi:MAG: helix-turn-helix domain-containing protein [Acidimicrobiia bacterium]